MKALGIAAVAVVVSGCATTAVPTGMKAGQFVQFACEGGKRFQARASDDGKTVRVRYEGGWELDRKADGVFESDGWKLVTVGPDAAELLHNNKSIGKRCKAEA